MSHECNRSLLIDQVYETSIRQSKLEFKMVSKWRSANNGYRQPAMNCNDPEKRVNARVPYRALFVLEGVLVVVAPWILFAANRCC